MAEWPWRYRSRSKVIVCDTPADHLCPIWKESIQKWRRHITERTRHGGWTDRRMDIQTDRVKPIYPSPPPLNNNNFIVQGYNDFSMSDWSKIHWIFHDFCIFTNFSWNSMIFPWSWNRSEFQWFFKSCGNPAFDTVDRGKFFKMLHNTLLPEELHLLNRLVNDVSIRVRVGKETGEEINKLLGIMQGDCLNAILFIVDLAQVMTPTMLIHQAEHSYAKNVQLNPVPISARKPGHQEDHSYASKPHLPNHRKPFMIVQNMLMISHGSLSHILHYNQIYSS